MQRCPTHAPQKAPQAGNNAPYNAGAIRSHAKDAIRKQQRPVQRCPTHALQKAPQTGNNAPYNAGAIRSHAKDVIRKQQRPVQGCPTHAPQKARRTGNPPQRRHKIPATRRTWPANKHCTAQHRRPCAARKRRNSQAATPRATLPYSRPAKGAARRQQRPRTTLAQSVATRKIWPANKHSAAQVRLPVRQRRNAQQRLVATPPRSRPCKKRGVQAPVFRTKRARLCSEGKAGCRTPQPIFLSLMLLRSGARRSLSPFPRTRRNDCAARLFRPAMCIRPFARHVAARLGFDRPTRGTF